MSHATVVTATGSRIARVLSSASIGKMEAEERLAMWITLTHKRRENMENEIDAASISAERNKLAAQQLGLDDEWEITYIANQVGFIHDCSEPGDHLDFEWAVTQEEVETAIQKSVRYFDTPKGWRLVGMQKKANNPWSAPEERKYGLVDFSTLGAE